MVAASATAILTDINFSSARTDRPKLRSTGNCPLARIFVTAPVNRMVSTRGRQGPASTRNKENVRNKVNDKKTTLGWKDAGAADRVLTSA
ncbi:hypothetical protein ACQ5SK_20440 [Bradyrhizobium japonicum]